MAEKKERKKLKEKKPESILFSLSNIHTSLSEAMKARETIFGRVAKLAQTTAISLASLEQPLNSLALSLQTMDSFYTVINSAVRQQQAIMRVLETPPVLQAMFQFQAQVNTLTEGLARIREMVELPKISIPTITTELTAIPLQNNRTIESLLRHIDRLEEELSKEKAKNKELLRLLENMKKRAKQQYIE